VLLFRSRCAHRRAELGSFVVGVVVFEIVCPDWDARQAETFFFSYGDRKADKSIWANTRNNPVISKKKYKIESNFLGRFPCSFILLSRLPAHFISFSALSQ